MKMFIMVLLAGAINVTATVYNALKGQTNDDNLHTASMKVIDPDAAGSHRWIAVSRDLEELGFVFGVEVCVEGAGEMNGVWTIEDRMNRRFTKRIDFLVDNDIKLGRWDDVRIRIEK